MSNYRSGTEPLSWYPVIDNRTKEQLIEQIRQIAPYYVKEWKFRPEDPDPGAALMQIFIHLLEGNIRRLNQVPYKSFLAFLNNFHVELSKARPAMAQVTFNLVEGAPEPVLVEKGTQLSATVSGVPDPVIFETVQPILLTTAKLADLFAVSPKRDRIVRLADENLNLAGEDGRGTALYGLEGENLQEHVMYFRHDFLFLLNNPAFLELAFSHSTNENAVHESVQQLADGRKVRWEFFSGGEWVPFDRVHGRRNVIRLVKLRPKPIDPSEYQGQTGYWIRCRVETMDSFTGASSLAKVQFERVLVKSEYAAASDDAGILPDRLFFNDLQVDAEEGCLPFGDFFAPYGLFYIANKEAFSKRGARIKIRFRLGFEPHRLLPDKPPDIKWKMVMRREELDKTDVPDPVTISLVQWEYWNGNSWAMLPVSAEARRMFSVPREDKEEVELEFQCPDDIREILVNSEENYWIRARILQVVNAYSSNAVYYSPTIERMRIRFGYDQPIHAPQELKAANHLKVLDHTAEAQSGGFPVRPFRMLEGAHPAVWFRFDAPPERGPIHLYFHMKPTPVSRDDVPYIEWEYLKRTGGGAVWAPLAVADDTNGFTQSGSIQFAGPRDFAQAEHFGVSGCWIRAVNRDGRYDREDWQKQVPRVLDILPNTVPVVQQRTIRNEHPRRVEQYDTLLEEVTEYYMLAESPVLSEEVWVDETEEYRSAEPDKGLEQSGEMEIIRDSDGQVMRVWVRYHHVEHFLRSGPADRHYTIDRATGRLTFGDGMRGKRPPRFSEDVVRVTYTHGGGKKGNVPAGAINTLLESISFVDAVANKYPAAGGCDAGTVEEAVIRGPKKFTHMGRAVTAEDFEWLTREAHPNVAKVKCLPNVNAKLEKEPGAVTIVVLQKSGIGSGAHFQELKRTVEQRLLECAASNVAVPGKIQVIEPALMEIGVQATIWVKSMEDVIPAEREILQKLDAFLDPITGNADGRGWEIGQIVHPSMFYSLLKSVGPVVHIPRLSLDVYKVEYGERTEWNPDKIADLPHSIVVPGKHRLTIELKK